MKSATLGMLVKSCLKVMQSQTKFLMIFLVTSTALSLLGLNQNQIANAQQLQGFQNNLASSSSFTKQQQPTGIYISIDNMTFSHHTDFC